MKLDQTIEILEALASGCSPQTGELLKNESVLNERDVIRALEKAITELERINPSIDKGVTSDEIKISSDEVDYVIKLFQSVDYNPSYSRLTHFFLMTKRFDIPELDSDSLYGKYHAHYSKHILHEFFSKYLTENGLTLSGKKRKFKEPDPWHDINFFKKEKFNNLSQKAINQLKDKINEIGVLKTENLTDYVVNARVNYPRAYESWSDKEKGLLKKALEFTNDLDLLSECFQRGPGSISSCGKKLLYEDMN